MNDYPYNNVSEPVLTEKGESWWWLEMSRLGWQPCLVSLNSFGEIMIATDAPYRFNWEPLSKDQNKSFYRWTGPIPEPPKETMR